MDLNCKKFVWHFTFSGREFQRTGAAYLKDILPIEDVIFWYFYNI